MIGIFGGTFDPVHYGHIKPALDVQHALSLEELRFIPCSIPAHREAPIATTAQRISMLQAAIDDEPKCIIDTRELNRQGVSYMVDTLQSLHDDFPNTRLCLIIGLDAFLNLHRWSRWQTIFDLAHCVVTYRPGCELNFETLHPELQWLVKNRHIEAEVVLKDTSVFKQTDGVLVFMPVTQLDISATDIRKRVKQQKSIDKLVATPVNNIIQQQKIYIG